MTDTASPPLTDAELIELAHELSATPRRPTMFGADLYTKRQPIAGSNWDQVVPDAIRNPLWEIVRQMAAEPGLFGHGRPEPDGHWAFLDTDDMKRAYAAGLDRHSLCARYAWSIPSPGDIGWIADLARVRGIVEIGAGAGYWTWQMRQAGLDVIAYDPHPPGPDNRYAKHEPWAEVIRGDHTRIVDHPGRALLMVWPGYGEPWAAEALKLYGGDLLLYAGEGPGGCTADDGFYQLLDEQWDECSASPWHVTYWCIHCRLTAYRRRK